MVRCYPTECTLAVGGCSDCLVGAVETTAPPGRVRGYGRDAIPSYANLNTLTSQHLTTLIRILVINGQEALFAFGRDEVGELQSGVGAVGKSQDEDMLVGDVVGRHVELELKPRR